MTRAAPRPGCPGRPRVLAATPARSSVTTAGMTLRCQLDRVETLPRSLPDPPDLLVGGLAAMVGRSGPPERRVGRPAGPDPDDVGGAGRPGEDAAAGAPDQERRMGSLHRLRGAVEGPHRVVLPVERERAVGEEARS